MMSAVVYLTLGFMVARTQHAVALKIYLLSLALFLTLLVGLSRVYLGVHWPSDVLAGWAVGASWALMCWLVMSRLQETGKVEPETQADG
jgi:undecaprenyl-diphosphatase